MNLTELKTQPVSTLVALGESMGLENLARLRKHFLDPQTARKKR